MLWQGVHRMIEAHLVNKISQSLYDHKEVDIPSIGKATWDGKSDEFTVKMEPFFHQMLTQKRKKVKPTRSPDKRNQGKGSKRVIRMRP